MEAAGLQGKIIWITGASSGIGNSLLEQLLHAKANVIASSRNIDSLLEVKQKYPDQLTVIKLDVCDLSAVKDCVKQIQQKYQKLDIVILNAGNCIYVEINNFKTEIIQKNFDVNFFGITNCIEASLPLLINNKGSQIIGISSSAAYLPLPRAEGYGAAKAAVSYLLRVLQTDLKRYEIDVTVVCPGFVDTPLTKQNDFPMPFLISSDAAAKHIIKGILRRSTEVNFPYPLILILKVLASLPDKIRIFLLSKMVQRT